MYYNYRVVSEKYDGVCHKFSVSKFPLNIFHDESSKKSNKALKFVRKSLLAIDLIYYW